MRKKNGAELLLMGANPTKLEKQRDARGRAGKIRSARLNNPLMNANFTTSEKMELGRLGISWTAIQTPADVRKAKRALADANKIRRRFGNPMPITEQRERAAEIYSGFHATPPKNKIVMDEPHIPAGAYPELGLLILIKFKPTNPNAVEHYEKSYETPSENVHVIGTLERDQMHFAGGDQRIGERELRHFGWDGHEQNFRLGDARQIIYLAQKYHKEVEEDARGEFVEWKHSFGEETGVLPELWYDTVVRRIYLKQGEYQIRDEGITN